MLYKKDMPPINRSFGSTHQPWNQTNPRISWRARWNKLHVIVYLLSPLLLVYLGFGTLLVKCTWSALSNENSSDTGDAAGLLLQAVVSDRRSFGHSNGEESPLVILSRTQGFVPLPGTLTSGLHVGLTIDPGEFGDKSLEYLLRVWGPSLNAAYGDDVGNTTMINFTIDVPGIYGADLTAYSLHNGSILLQANESELPIEMLLYQGQINVTQGRIHETPNGVVPNAYTMDGFWTNGSCYLGYWLERTHPSVGVALSALAVQAQLPWLWHSKCSTTEPVMVTPTEMTRILTAFPNIVFLGDSLMRTIFQGMIDIATNYSSPFPGIATPWCRKNITRLAINERSELSIFGDGCWSGGATFTSNTDKSKSILVYYDRHHSGQSINEVFNPTERVDWIFVNYGLHDIGMFTVEQFAVNLKDRLIELRGMRINTGSPPNIVYVGLWAQNIARKPLSWKWSASHKRALAFISAMKRVTTELDIPYIDTYYLTLPVLDANRDGVHYNESVTRTIAMLLAKKMQSVLYRDNILIDSPNGLAR
jgi:hypothetical protein